MHLQLVLIVIFSATCVSAVPDKVVCYHESWSNWRPSTGKFNISNTDTEICTHIIYSNIGIQPDGSIYLKSDDPEYLFAYGILRTRNPRPKLLVSISGWNDLSLIAANSNSRNTLLNNSVNFLKQYCFDGIDFNLEDPGDIECDSTNHNNIVNLLDQFRAEFNKNAFLLTARVSSSTKNYNVPDIVRNLDLVNVRTYYFESVSESANGQNLPYFETVNIINAWKNAGTPSNKLILGISAYGYSYKLQHNSAGAPFFVPGDAGEYTQQTGSLSYLEICEKIKDGVCSYKWNNEELVPYANCDNQWIIYENSETTLKKAKFALENNLGGMFIWSVNTDDFRGSCGSKYPLLNAIKSGLKQAGCTGYCPLLGNIICYHEILSNRRQGLGRFTISDVDPSLCTHMYLGSIGINYIGSISISAEDESFLSGYRAFKTRNPAIKLLLSIGGSKVPSTVFSEVAGNSQSRRTLLSNALNLIGRFSFDGLDFHWEDLTDPARIGISTDMNNFLRMLTEFRTGFGTYGYLLTATVSASTKYYNVPELNRPLDFINVKTFDFHGSWESRTGLNSPLSDTVNSIFSWRSAGAPTNKLVLGIGTYGTSFTLSNTTDNGIGALATGPGTPGPYTRESGFLGYNEIGCGISGGFIPPTEEDVIDLAKYFILAHSSSSKRVVPPKFMVATKKYPQKGVFHICEKLMSGWTRKWSSGPYAYSGNQWVGYDDAESINTKAKFVFDYKLGGIMVWTIDTDDFKRVCGTRYPLLNAVRNALTRSLILTLTNEESTPEDIKFLEEKDISNEFEILQSDN